MPTRYLAALVVLFIMVVSVTTVFAQKGVANSGSEPVPKTKVTGKIAFNQGLGGYYIKADNPPEEYMIKNPNPEVLKKLMESGKRVTIRGSFPGSADILFIERIDGKAYKGKERQK
jgi:hypothetical protein